MTEKKEKGDLAVAKTILDLVEKEYTVFTPTFSEHLPFDLIAYKDCKSFRIQVKYTTNDIIRDKTIWNDKNGAHVRKYNLTDFDYYALYYPSLDKVLYPNISFGGCVVASEVRQSATPFYWWEDFQEFTDIAQKKTYKDFGFVITRSYKERIGTRKVVRPSKEELEKLLWEKPTLQLAKDFGVSDKAIEKWCKSYGISKPPRGYWSK